MKYIRKKNTSQLLYRDSKVKICHYKKTYNFSYHLPGSNIIIDIVLVELTIDVGNNKIIKR